MSVGSQCLRELTSILLIESTGSGLLGLAGYTEDDISHSTEAFQLL